MAKVRSVPGGGRAVELQPERLQGWFERFGERHGGIHDTEIRERDVVVTAKDGARAELVGEFEPGAWPGLEIGQVLEELMRPKRIGLLLVRLGGHSIGIAVGGRVEVSTTDSHLVHGRNKAGGWSQQRFARRREGQARVALQAAADDAVRVLAPRIGELDAVVLGGDRQALDVLREDRRLADVFAKAADRVLDVAEPRRAVLDDAAVRARAVEVVVRD
ncbi:hypothetical protein FKR81_32755 [Lentzea tibetensis]|uniref:Actinobacteria/chloroflexi VLRF1 release factor domain-containing protein n=1 Tax=Lentzea tibetensis TaxID=2591470 RepID=A0A563EJW6_9PSEU|nr:acVLRF1 family peptidyl-tRNA hydrolase [Lentzea tibetensis]TWP47233.1 hypothetical protein FKR81_32755 [Lentzea tibetensis]